MRCSHLKTVLRPTLRRSLPTLRLPHARRSALPTTLNLIAWGEGLGGTLAIAAAAKQPQHVVKCAAQNPLCTGAYADCAQYAAQLVCPLLMGHIRHGHDRPAGRAKRRL